MKLFESHWNNRDTSPKTVYSKVDIYEITIIFVRFIIRVKSFKLINVEIKRWTKLSKNDFLFSQLSKFVRNLANTVKFVLSAIRDSADFNIY